MNRHVDREDISGTGGEVFMEFFQDIQLVNELFRLLTDRDSGSRCDVLILSQTYLCIL